MTFFQKCILALVIFYIFSLSVILLNPTIPYCQAEDSENCIWNAQTMGNLSGRSFIRWEGVTYYAEEIR